MIPGQALALSPEDRDKLAAELCDLITDLEQQHRLRLLNYQTYWNWYMARPATERRTDPWEGASNIVVPVIRVSSDAVAARYYNALTATGRLFMGTTQNDEFEPYVQPVTDFINYATRVEFDMYGALRDGILEMVVTGVGLWALRWEQQQATVFVPGTKSNRRLKVTVRRSPVLEHVPGERLLWDTNHSITDAPVVIRQAFLTYADMLRMTHDGYWDEEAVEKTAGASVLGSQLPSVQVYNRRRQATGVPTEQAPDPYQPHDIREVHLDYPFLRSLKLSSLRNIEPEDDQLPIVVTLHEQSRQLLRVIAKPYYLVGNPFYGAYFRKVPGPGDTPGMARLLHPIQHGASVLTNQSIDAVTFANSITGVTNDPKLIEQRTTPNRWLFAEPGSASPFNLSKAIQPDIAILNTLLAMGERVAGVSDPQLGREVRMGGHPAPATSTMALLSESNKLYAMGLQEVRRVVSRMGIDIATLYQQFETNVDGHITRAIGQADGRVVQEWLMPTEHPIFGNLELDLAALSETLNPEAARNTAMMLDQVTTNYYARVLQFLQVMSNPQVPPMARVAAGKGIEALGQTYTRVLQMSDIDQIEKFTFDLEEGARRAATAIQLAQQSAAPVAGPPTGAGAAPPGGLPGPGMGSPAGPPPQPEGVPSPSPGGLPQ